VVEQCCNSFLRHDCFPASYEELQPIPLLASGLLSYAGDDGGEQGQAYRLALNLEAGAVWFRFRCPDAQGNWGWRRDEVAIPLPEHVLARLRGGAELLAPTLREVVAASGGRYAVVDLALAVSPAQPLPAWGAVERVLGVDWGVHTLITATSVAAADGDEQSQQLDRPLFLDTGGFDGRQAHTRRQIDQLNKKCAGLSRNATPFLRSTPRTSCIPDASRRSWMRRVAAGANTTPATGL
jgi:putative transposase